MNYRENIEASEKYKETYTKQIEKLIKEKQKTAREKRIDYSKNIFTDPERYRRDLRAMLGWPLVDYKPEGIPRVKSYKLSCEDGYTVFRLQIEILPELMLSGLYFCSTSRGKRPLVIVQHGRYGTPERISGAYGETYNYNDMLERVRCRGVDVFAPQLLLWGEQYGVPFDRYEIDAHLKRVGSSICAVELFGITRILDYLESLGIYSAFGMVGLSYGGFYTLYAAAIDKRIASSISCSFFNSRDSVAFPDWTWHRSAELFDDAEVACLVYPRRILLEMGDDDELFDLDDSLNSYERIKELASDVGTDWLELIPFSGTHEFHKDDAPIEKLVRDLSGI